MPRRYSGCSMASKTGSTVLVVLCLLTGIFSQKGYANSSEKKENGINQDENMKKETGFEFKDRLVSLLSDSLNTESGTQLKQEMKQELMRLILKEIVAEIKDDIDNDRFDINSAPREVADSVQEIKGYYKSKMASNARFNKNFNERKKTYLRKVIKDERRTSDKHKTRSKERPSRRFSNQNESHGISESMSSPSRRQTSDSKIAFTAYFEGELSHLGLLQTIKFNRILLNDGNGYNAHTGVFTAPVTGVYLFSLQFLSYWGKTELRLVMDSVNQVDAQTDHFSGQHVMVQSGNSAAIRVKAGQSVWVETYHMDDGMIGSTPGFRMTTFVGALLYADN